MKSYVRAALSQYVGAAFRRPAVQHEWQQFRLLSRDSVRRLLDSILVSRDADPMLFALWFTALAMTPPMLVAVPKIIQYYFLQRAPAAMVLQIATAERAFFVLYGMLATALLAALTWDALFPDRQDQEIVGALPVRPRTLASARLAAALTVGTAFAAAICLPAAFIYSAASSTHPLIGSFPRVLAAHITATMMACACTFLGLMSLRAVVVICAGERVADRLALVLQFVTIVMLVETFLFLPSVLPNIIKAMQQGQASYAWAPPVWFTALFLWMAEGSSVLGAHVAKALAATAIVTVLVVIVSLAPAAWLGRRVLEVRTLDRASGLATLARSMAVRFVRRPVVRSMFVFGVASLARSRRHTIQLATYLGMAIALAVLKLIPPLLKLRGNLVLDEPRAYTLALPLVLIFFAVFGLRAAFQIPTELDANWVFRLAQPTVRDAVRASRWLILMLGVLPISIVWLLVTLTMWPVHMAIWATLFDLMIGMLLTELALSNWTKIPFASAHEPATETLKSKVAWYVTALLMYQFIVPEVQVRALQSWRTTLTQVATVAVLVVALRVWRSHTLRKRTPTFDVVTSETTTLNLSEALS
jgi:hypothetical protein